MGLSKQLRPLTAAFGDAALLPFSDLLADELKGNLLPAEVVDGDNSILLRLVDGVAFSLFALA